MQEGRSSTRRGVHVKTLVYLFYVFFVLHTICARILLHRRVPACACEWRVVFQSLHFALTPGSPSPSGPGLEGVPWTPALRRRCRALCSGEKRWPPGRGGAQRAPLPVLGASSRGPSCNALSASPHSLTTLSPSNYQPRLERGVAKRGRGWTRPIAMERCDASSEFAF